MEENPEKSSGNKVKQSILLFVKSKQVKSRISENEDENSEGAPKHNGSQNFEVRMITLQRHRTGADPDQFIRFVQTCQIF